MSKYILPTLTILVLGAAFFNRSLRVNPVAEPSHQDRNRAGTTSDDAGEVMTRPPIPGRWVDVVMEVTAYCAPCDICCAGANDGITASGYDVRERSVSHFLAAPKQIPIGTVMCVPGYNDGRPVVVLDRMPGKGNKIDCYFEDGHQAALNFGRHKTLTVQIWSNE